MYVFFCGRQNFYVGRSGVGAGNLTSGAERLLRQPELERSGSGKVPELPISD